MNTFSSRNVEAADRLAPGQLDDDGAPPAVTRHQAGGSHDRDAIRRGRIGQVAASLADGSITGTITGALPPASTYPLMTAAPPRRESARRGLDPILRQTGRTGPCKTR